MAQYIKPHHLCHSVFFLSLLPSILTELAETRREGEALVKWKNSLATSSFLDTGSPTGFSIWCVTHFIEHLAASIFFIFKL